MEIDLRKIKSFLKNTKALAICGYKSEVDWMKSTAFELLVLSVLQDNEFSGRGITAIGNRIKDNFDGLAKELKFRMVTKKDI